ncbi:MAG: RNA 2',3'-cyclic phosphodiesterase [Clostridiales bacterium]|nr:RNA 2',3'-cyclic phosphodiesterase [Clostridiales bacterium]
MRAFIAIDFNDGLKSRISGVQNELRSKTVSGRWKHRDNFHLTLKFLDEINREQFDDLKSELENISRRHACFTLNIAEIGRFQGRDSIRVLWLGLGGDLDKLVKLQSDIEEAAVRIGFPRETRSFRPHVTIGQDILPGKGFENKVSGLRTETLQEIKVDRFEIFNSEQIGLRRIYTSMASFMLDSGRNT